MKHSTVLLLVALALGLFVAAAEGHGRPSRRYRQALAAMTTGDGSVDGYVLFTQQAGRKPCIVEAFLTGLTPGKHGWHVHEFGNLTQVCNSTGNHYNPTDSVHGDINEIPSHVGDLGNLIADENGNANFTAYARRLRLTGGRSIIGRGIVIHGGEDDLGRGGDATSLINGNSGARIACGVIGVLDVLF